MQYSQFVKENLAKFAGLPASEKFKKVAALWKQHKAGENESAESDAEEAYMPMKAMKSKKAARVMKQKKVAKDADDDDVFKMLGIQKTQKAKSNFVKAARQLQAKKAEDAEPIQAITQAPSAVAILKAIENPPQQAKGNTLAKQSLGF
jgi:hypothetical protein